VLLDVSQDNAMDDSDILDDVGVLARDVVANERAEGVAALGAMMVDERFGALLDGSQGDAMDDSGGQGFGGVFAGGVFAEEVAVHRHAAGGGGGQGAAVGLVGAGVVGGSLDSAMYDDDGRGGGLATPVLAEDRGDDGVVLSKNARRTRQRKVNFAIAKKSA